MIKKFGLGRGLSSLIPQASTIQNKPEELEDTNEPDDFGAIEALITDEGERVLQISPLEIEINPFQPRKDFNRRELDDLINSIREHGIIQPLVATKVENGYQLIAGERRLRSSQILELATVPVVIREVSDIEKLELALIENIQRSSLNPLEEAMAYRRLADEFSLTQEKIAKKVGKNRATVANILRVLNLPEEIQQALGRGQINLSQAKTILSVETPGEQLELYQRCLVGSLNTTELMKEADKVNRNVKRMTQDLDLEVKEDRLRQALGTKVRIRRRGEKGRIEIEFYSDEDLNKLMGEICN